MFTIEFKDYSAHFFIEQTENKFYVFKVTKDSLVPLQSFETAIEAINYCLKALGREGVN